MTKKVVIIGGGGFIGSNLLKYLIENRDYQIHVADSFSRNSENLAKAQSLASENPRIRVINADFSVKDAFSQLDNDYDYVYMLASVVGVDKVNFAPHETIRINTKLIMNCIDWLAESKCGRVLFSSTSEAYAGTIEAFEAKIPTPEDVPLTIEDISHPRFSYAVTKMLGESAFINFANKGFFEAVVVRYHNVYGPNMGFRHVLPHVVERFRNNEDPFLLYGNDQSRAFNYIDDAIVGTVLALEKGKSGEVYHIGDTTETTIGELIRYVGELFEFRGEYEDAPTFPGSTARRCPDISKASNDLGYEAKVSWKEGVLRTVNWYQEFLDQDGRRTESFYDEMGIQNAGT